LVQAGADTRVTNSEGTALRDFLDETDTRYGHVGRHCFPELDVVVVYTWGHKRSIRARDGGDPTARSLEKKSPCTQVLQHSVCSAQRGCAMEIRVARTTLDREASIQRSFFAQDEAYGVLLHY
jgi:hypothetical protein